MQEPADHSDAADFARSPGDEIDLLSCNVGHEVFCIDVASIHELRGWTEPPPLPHGPACLSGVINLRGIILPVVDLGAGLGIPPWDADPRNVIIVVCEGGPATGLAVSSVSDIHKEARTSLTPSLRSSDGIAETCISALALIEDRTIRIIDIAALMPHITLGAA